MLTFDDIKKEYNKIKQRQQKLYYVISDEEYSSYPKHFRKMLGEWYTALTIYMGELKEIEKYGRRYEE